MTTKRLGLEAPDRPGLSDLTRPRWQPTTFPTARHERVHRLLGSLISGGAAAFFADACDIIQRDPPLRSTTHLVGHLSREVESALRQVLRTLPNAAEQLKVSTKEKKGHQKEIDAIIEGFGLGDDPIADDWRSFAGKTALNAWSAAAHRDDLRNPRVPDSGFRDRFDLFVGVLDAILQAAESSYASVLALLEPIYEKDQPTTKAVSTLAVHLAPGVAALSHIFKELSASWLQPLRKKAVFADPPDLEVRSDGSFSFPDWPQARYLHRIASEEPEEVTKTIEDLPDTRSLYIHQILLETAIEMPAQYAARVARRELKWIADESSWLGFLVPKAIGKLVIHLWDGAQHDSAIEVLEASLWVAPADRSRRMESWAYGNLVDATLPPIGKEDPDRIIELLFFLINDAEQKGHRLLGRQIDAPRRPGQDPLSILLVHLRTLLLVQAASGSDGLMAVVDKLEEQGTVDFERLVLHVLRVHGDSVPALVVERAANSKNLGRFEIKNEMRSLVRDQFPNLEEADQRRVLVSIREANSPATIQDENDGCLKDDLATEWSEGRTLKWLHLLKGHLPAEEKATYQRLLSKHGEPQEPQRGVQTGPNPPRRAAELADLTDDKLLEYLRAWEPESEEPFEPSYSGLGSEIHAIVKKDPLRFSSLARKFRDHRVDYVANVLRGLSEIVKQVNRWNTKNKSPENERPLHLLDVSAIDWKSIFDLARWTVNQEGEDWRWARGRAIDVAEELFVATSDEELRIAAWKEIVAPVLSDNDPSPDRDAERGSDRDFAINTVRGQALHAAIRIATTMSRDGENQEALSSVCDALRKRAKPANEPSEAIRLLLAIEFTNLRIVDEPMAQDIALELFDPGADSENAAWGSFLKRNYGWPGTYRVLESRYKEALDMLGANDAHDADLGKHLAWLATRGAFDHQTEGNPLQCFVEQASEAARREGLEDIGRAIYRTEEDISDEMRDRLRVLWDWWASISRGRGSAHDLTAFGWWFSNRGSPEEKRMAGHFDPNWSLAELQAVLRDTNGEVDHPRRVVETLATMAGDHPESVAKALVLFVDGNTQPYFKLAIRTSLAKLQGTAAEETAQKIVSRLVARGWNDFRDLFLTGNPS